ncbi:MAG: hypothetical protein ACRC7D_20860 [Aeromonas popoffii]|uniref:hypothetical protein n=1 Tax=Aeromonas popoffii TaxID=70856 RepID=UPI003F35C770
MNTDNDVVDELFDSQELKGQLSARDGNTYRADLKKRLDALISQIENMRNTNTEHSSYLIEKIDELKKVNYHLIKSLDEYLTGSAGKAYSEIDSILSSDFIKEHMEKMVRSMTNFPSGYPSPTGPFNDLYRIRVSNTPIKKRKDMFHIPFESRHLVSNQRFSIAGVPCLYLGSSLYVCWEEMGTPNFNKLYLSRVKCKSDIKILDLSYSLETMKKNVMDYCYGEIEDDDEKLAKLIFLPIRMACSYNRAHASASFHEEYIIPSLILQWISKSGQDISGIAYLSTRLNQIVKNYKGINFVFPPDTASVKETGYCDKLSDVFEISKPVSWQLLDTYESSHFNDIQVYVTDITNPEEDYLINYNCTKFCHQELKLQKIPTSNIKNND